MRALRGVIISESASWVSFQLSDEQDERDRVAAGFSISRRVGSRYRGVNRTRRGIFVRRKFIITSAYRTLAVNVPIDGESESCAPSFPHLAAPSENLPNFLSRDKHESGRQSHS